MCACSAGVLLVLCVALCVPGWSAASTAFVCPSPNPSFADTPTDYVCPLSAEGGFPYEWLQPVSVSDYPTTSEVSLKTAALRRLWPIGPQTYWDPQAWVDYDESEGTSLRMYKVMFFIYYNLGLLLLLRIVIIFHDTVTDPSLEKYRKEPLTSDGTYQRRVKWLRRLDISGQECIEVRKLQSMLDEASYRQVGLQYDVKKRKTIAGGRVTWLCLNVAISVYCILVYLVTFSTTPALPGALSEEIPLAIANERYVNSIPFTSLSSMDASALQAWIESNDSLYVSEVVGGDWGTECVDYSLVSDLPFDETLEVVYAASAGLLPSGAQAVAPTTMEDLRTSGSFGVTSVGCRIQGSGESCDAAFNDWFDTINSPFVAYGCYMDPVGVYHHLSAVSSALIQGFAEGGDVSYTLTWQPSTEYPGFGLNTPAGVKLHVLPPSTSLVYGDIVERHLSSFLSLTDNIGEVQPKDQTFSGLRWSRYDQGSILSCRWREILQLPADSTVTECYGEDSEPLYPGRSLFGNDINGNTTWDASRVVSQAIGPIPESQTSDNLADSTFSCSLSCTDSGMCRYTGQYCEELRLGSVLGAETEPVSELLQSVFTKAIVAHYTDPENYDFTQPSGIICPHQHFHISTQQGLTSCGIDPFFNRASNWGMYGSVYNDLAVSPSICHAGSTPSADQPLSVTISREVVDTVARVEFSLPAFSTAMTAVVVYSLELFGLHALVLWIGLKIHKRHAKKKAKIANVARQVALNCV
ncbi:hypothetical protein KIPB_001421 [Kipferlia bialata]|uniref:Uncharacterized protein n=1 Tax=Kipferlia bialata TaxID=797122 RepID=A0A9K3GFI6_9EUKA|nr:hypothetical protein KIPB_001421 [Kipferlia bialata]|eukprot:g1421.t1